MWVNGTTKQPQIAKKKDKRKKKPWVNSTTKHPRIAIKIEEGKYVGE